MSLIVPLDPIPNQSITIRLDGRRYAVTMKEIGGVMGATIERDGVILATNVRCVAGYPLLNYPNQAQDAGNFIFTNAIEGAIPYYTDFGTTCLLVYSTAAEIAADVLASLPENLSPAIPFATPAILTEEFAPLLSEEGETLRIEHA